MRPIDNVVQGLCFDQYLLRVLPEVIQGGDLRQMDFCGNRFFCGQGLPGRRNQVIQVQFVFLQGLPDLFAYFINWNN